MYNMLPDLFIMLTFIGTLAAVIHFTDRKPKPYNKVHMVDQKGRYK